MLPALTCASELAAKSHIVSTLPATMSCNAGAPPRYGTSVAVVPVTLPK
jgi:hypothetical protein